MGFDVAGKALAGAAEFESFEGNTPFLAEVFELGGGLVKGGADLGLEATGESALVAGAVQVVEQFSDLVGKFLGSSEVEPVLASLVAVGQLVVGSESLAAIGSPSGGNGALSGEDFEIGLEELSDSLEAGDIFVVLANGIVFFRVLGGRMRGGGYWIHRWVLANGIALFVV